MDKILKIGKALYIVDDETKTYKYLGRNPDWKKHSESEEEINKKHIDGYTRILRDGKTRLFRYKGRGEVKENERISD